MASAVGNGRCTSNTHCAAPCAPLSRLQSEGLPGWEYFGRAVSQQHLHHPETFSLDDVIEAIRQHHRHIELLGR
jgi:hypothetical protein